MTSSFTLSHPLPLGHVPLEASAGTGKTFTIVGLAARYLAEGRCTADQLLMVTFSRSATKELRARLLERLDRSAVVLRRAVDGLGPPVGEDAVDSALVDGDAAEVASRLQRLDAALAHIDDATVTTIHGFCDDLLRRIGDPMLGELLVDTGELASQITADLYLRIARSNPELVRRLPELGHARLVVQAGMTHPPSAIQPERDMGNAAGLCAFMAYAAGIEARSRKQAARVHTYDDLVDRLAEHLGPEDAGHGLLAQLRRRFTVGLVDEFQDTDPAQWRIFSALFPDVPGGDGRTLVLVGDPKQAIYAFRGADLHTYLRARSGVVPQTLGTNHRTDRPLVNAVTALFQDVPLGPPPVRVRQLESARDTRLHPAPPGPISFRVVPDDAAIPKWNRRFRADPARQFVAADVAAHVVRMLRDGPTLTVGATPGDRGEPRRLEPSDITVLVRKNSQAAMVQHELWQREVPTVLNGVGNVLLTPAATDWLALLQALQQPSQGSSARRAALTDLLGWDLERLARDDERDLDDLHVTLHEMADHLEEHGVASAFKWIDARVGLSPRLRSLPAGNRRLADLIHLTELLHAEQRHAGLGLPGLVGWLEQAVATAADPAPDGLARRLEQAGNAVEIMTVHSAKGLERGVVLVPFLWDSVGARSEVLSYTDPATGARMVDVGGRSDNPAWRQAAALTEAADEEEELRLAYVALTRGRHQAVVWWADGNASASSALALILGRGTRTDSTAEAVARMQDLVVTHPGCFEVVDVPVRPDPSRHRTLAAVPDLRLATLGRTVDQGWRRYSYSRLVSQQTGSESDTDVPGADGLPAPGGEDDPPGQADGVADIPRPAAGADPPTDPDPAVAAVVGLSGMPGGADVGTAIHKVLELVDFDLPAPDRAAQLGQLLAAQALSSPVDLSQVDGVVDGLQAMIETPMGPIADNRPLSTLSRADRLDELDFEMPVLRGPDADVAGRLLLADIADVLEAHLPPTDPLRDYPGVLRAGLGEVEVRGFLAGQVDLVARVRGADGTPDRFVVADYKTNRVAPPGADPLRVGHYSTAAMAAEMIHHHYPLQALIYLVATHRYLRWRLPGYDPDVHMAGSAYLFLRGMTGAQAPTQPDGTAYGVMAWRPTTSLLLALDGLLADGADR